ncbi:MAG: hypothetical protein NTZ64_13295 [Polaromonas sp.]|nr:hypothetical protein [Polaromonas sp.]
MQLHKTSRAHAELKPGVRTLGQRERTLLLLADGSKSAQDFHILFDGDGEEIALRLLSEGYLERLTTAKSAPPARAKISPAQESEAITPSELPSISSFGAPATGADSFEGKRSLATTRMFLFDICERMFTKRSPEMAAYFREILRNAKDRESMLTVSRSMLDYVEKLAGPERADALSERIAMLLPPENSLADARS